MEMGSSKDARAGPYLVVPNFGFCLFVHFLVLFFGLTVWLHSQTKQTIACEGMITQLYPHLQVKNARQSFLMRRESTGIGGAFLNNIF